jgi:hypothetical protein
VSISCLGTLSSVLQIPRQPLRQSSISTFSATATAATAAAAVWSETVRLLVCQPTSLFQKAVLVKNPTASNPFYSVLISLYLKAEAEAGLKINLLVLPVKNNLLNVD